MKNQCMIYQMVFSQFDAQRRNTIEVVTYFEHSIYVKSFVFIRTYLLQEIIDKQNDTTADELHVLLSYLYILVIEEWFV